MASWFLWLSVVEKLEDFDLTFIHTTVHPGLDNVPAKLMSIFCAGCLFCNEA